MLTRVVLAFDQPIPADLLALVPGQPRLRETEFGHQATSITEVDDPARLKASLLEAAGPVAVGVITGRLATESAHVVMFDVDSTLTTTESIDLLAGHAGKGPQVAAITERAMRGELDFAESLRERVATLEGLDAEVLADVAVRMDLSPGARSLVGQLHEAKVFMGMTSGGFIQLVGPLADELGFEFASANDLEVALVEGREQLTGQVLGAIVDGRHKARDLQVFIETVGADPELTLAVGDGANDIPMMDVAALGVAYCAKPVTAAHADVAISFSRLDAVAAFALVD